MTEIPERTPVLTDATRKWLLDSPEPYIRYHARELALNDIASDRTHPAKRASQIRPRLHTRPPFCRYSRDERFAVVRGGFGAIHRATCRGICVQNVARL